MWSKKAVNPVKIIKDYKNDTKITNKLLFSTGNGGGRMIELTEGVDNLLINGDCLQVLKELEDESVDSIVTDPPYELGFMG